MSTILRAVSNGATTIYAIPFPYLDKGHVKIYKDGILQLLTTDYTWLTSSSIQLVTSAVSGALVVIKRVTPTAPLTVFTPGNLDTDDLNVAVLQPLYVAEEGRDLGDLAWLKAPTDTTAGTILKGALDTIPGYDASGNLVPKTTLGAINSALSAAASAIASAASAAASAAVVVAALAGINLPLLSAAQAHKALVVNSGGTGYTLRRNPFYSPYEYGAAGNAVADDTAAINAAIAASVANDGFPAYRSYSAVVIPPGDFRTTGITLSDPGVRFMGQGGFLTAHLQSRDVLTVAASYVVVEDLLIYDPWLPSTATSCFSHVAGADCSFRKLHLVGGYYGFKGVGNNPLFPNAGDSSLWDTKIIGQYGDFVYLQNYAGLWCYRGKFDGYWPVQNPVAANDKGSWTAATAYNVGDFVLRNSYVYQCRVAGTSGGTGPVPTIVGTDIADGTTLKWRTHRRQDAAGLNMAGSCFTTIFHNTDFTGGHLISVRVNTAGGGTAPQGLSFSGRCEFGIPFYFGLWIQDGDGITLTDILIDGGVATNSRGISAERCRHLHMSMCHVYNFVTGIYLGATSSECIISNNMVLGCTSYAVQVAAGHTHSQILGNNLGSGLWGPNAGTILLNSGASDYMMIRDNMLNGATTPAIANSSSGTHNDIANNLT